MLIRAIIHIESLYVLSTYMYMCTHMNIHTHIGLARPHPRQTASALENSTLSPLLHVAQVTCV